MLKRILFIVLLIQCGNVYAKRPVMKFRHLTVKDGLVHGWIKCIYKDSYGYMWFGTGTSGINKYDGSNFTIYENEYGNKNTLSNNSLNSIHEDKNRNLWIGTGSGLNIYNRETDIIIPVAAFDNIFVNDIFELDNGKFILATYDNLILFDPKNDSLIYPNNLNENFSFRFIREGMVKYNSDLLIGTTQGLFYFDTNEYKLIPVYTNIDIRSIVIDANNRIWCGTKNQGLFCIIFKDNDLSRPVVKNYIHKLRNTNSISENAISALQIDNNNNLWIGTESDGLNILNLNDLDEDNFIFQHYRHTPNDVFSISHNSISAIYTDNEGTVWISTYNSGISYYNKLLFKFEWVKHNKNNKNSINDNQVNAIFQDDHYLWIGTQKGLNVQDLKTKKWEHFEYDENDNKSLGAKAVCAIFRDSRNNMWIGTWGGGLNLFNETTKTFTRFLHNPNDKSSIRSNNIFDIDEDKNGIIWIATIGGGLNSYDYKTNSFKSNLNDPVLATLGFGYTGNISITDEKDEILIAASGGFEIFNIEKGEVLHFVEDQAKPKSLSSKGVINVFKDSKRNIWVGTDNGLNLFNRDSANFKLYNKKVGLPNNVINAICEDNHGNLWISTNKGISKFVDAINRPESPVFENFDIEDGLQGNTFNARSCFKSKDGKLYFGGPNGFNVFHPDSIKGNPYKPPVIITKLLLFNKNVPIGTSSSPLKKHISVTKEIILSYKHSVISFEYAALNFLAPEKNQYAYMLEGFDKKWNYVGNKREATYTNMDPGKYVFRVKASNNDGIWNEEGTSLKIIVTPPFWKTTWFRFSTILSIISIVYVTHLIRVRSIVEHGRRLEIKVAERTKELDQANKELEESANKLKTIVDAVSEGFAIVDKKHVILEASEFLSKLFGLKREDIINKKCSQVFNPWEETCENCPLEKLFKNRERSPVIEKTKVSKNGTIRYFNIQCYPIPNHSKKNPKSVISIRDITERKNMEKKNIQNYKRKMKSLSHKLTLAEEHERKRIATTLHAEVGQTLAFLTLKMSELKGKESPKNIKEGLEEVYDLAQNAMTSTRLLMRQLSPSILYELGFVPAVEWLAENILRESNIRYSFEDDGEEKLLTDDLSVLLFQAVREILVNVKKHAKAKNVKISIKKCDKNIQIEVEDDGVGFDTSTLDSYVERDIGFGLLNIRSRIDVVGGHFEIESYKNKGTKIKLEAPLKI